MKALFSRRGWLLTGIAAVGLSVGLSYAIKQDQVSGEDHAPAASYPAPVDHVKIAQQDSTPTKTPEDLKHDPVVEHANALSRAFRESAHVAMPSVVTVYSKESSKKVRAERGEQHSFNFNGEDPFKGTPFEGRFKDMLPNAPDGGNYSFQTPPREGMGTGVIIDKSGIILTNNHVVEGADTVTVHFSDGREYKATEVKTDPHSDLAVIRIKAEGDLPAAHLGNSDDLEIGDWVIAIGNPFGQEKTVTAGIISGKGRQLGSGRSEYIQTDAAINPGNSGGPLVNLTGEVVGINTAIASNSGGYQGLGFAIPINQAKWVTQQLIKDGSVHRGYLGIQIGEVSNELASKLSVKPGEGALVADVFPSTPAADAKLQEEDIITKFAGHEIHSPHEVQEWVERSPLNTPEPVEIIRDGKPMMLSVTVKPMPEKYGMEDREPEEHFKKAPPASVYEANQLGLSVSDMSADETNDAYKGFEGVVIRKVEPDSAAAEKGLQPGMLIRKVGKTAVHTAKEFEAAMKNENLKDGVLLQIRTERGNHLVVLEPQQ
ncbi:MAG TPA: Do family serine endopeptidase [Pirellulales bacterium]|jgi:serine protease Do|nr:Do family serine endopeptidase [Pirellulales bacterium]